MKNDSTKFQLQGHFVSSSERQEFDYDKHLGPYHMTQQGVLKTTSLIYESSVNDKSDAVFTLKDDDYITNDGAYLFSLPRLYLSIGDPTEYQFAKTVFKSWRKWQKLKEAKFIRDNVQEWADELEIKMRSEAIRGIKDTAASAEASENVKFNSQKYVAEKGWEGKSKRGRPSKEEVERQKKIHAGLSSELEDDYSRITRTY